MKSSLVKVGIPLLIIIGAVGIAGVMIASKSPPEKKSTPKKAFLVDATAVHKKSLNYKVKSQGTVLPKVQTVLSAQVSGRVVNVAAAFIEGGLFLKGDVLVQLEQADYITDLKAAEAELARSNAALEEEQARGKVAAEEWRSVKNSVAPELGLRKPQLAKEVANVRAAEAKVERAQRNLERTTIRAPYDGLVKNKNVDLGQFVGTGSQLGTVYGTDVAEVRMPLSDNELAFLASAQNGESLQSEVNLFAKVAGKYSQWKGKLVRDEGVIDQQNRVVYAVAEIIDPYQRRVKNGPALRFGRFVQAEIQGARAEDIIVLPRGVLRLDGSVMVVGKDRKLRIRQVQIQRADETQVYISGGLEEGELVTATAIPNPIDGMTVRLPGDEPAEQDQPSGQNATAKLAGAGE